MPVENRAFVEKRSSTVTPSEPQRLVAASERGDDCSENDHLHRSREPGPTTHTILQRPAKAGHGN